MGPIIEMKGIEARGIVTMVADKIFRLKTIEDGVGGPVNK